MSRSQEPETIRLWPDGPPSDLGVTGDEIAYPLPAGVAAGTTSLRNISDTTLSVYPAAPDKATGVGVVVVPGGAWIINAITHEGHDVARWLSGLGHTAFVLKYRVRGSGPDQAEFNARNAESDARLASNPPTSRLPRKMDDLISADGYQRARDAAEEDGRRAVEWVRANASTYGVRPNAVGIMGFSAGAFLSADVAMGSLSPRPAFVGAIYGGESRGSRTVPADAPPLFSAVARDDLLWKIAEGLHRDWTDADRPSEFHLFSRGGHGFGMVKQGAPSDAWSDLFATWLADLDLAG